MVSAAEVAAIQATWGKCDSKKVGRDFYVKLKSEDKGAYDVFGFGDADPATDAKVGAQADKVMDFVGKAVAGLGDMGAVGKKLDELGSRHTKYGAKKAHFKAAGVALLFAVDKNCGGLSGDAKSGWTALYGVISDKITGHLAA